MFNNNKLNMLLSLVVAIALWAYVVSAINPLQSQMVKNIPVQFANENVLNERGLAIANAGVIGVDVTVEGSRDVISNTGPDSFTAVADVGDCIEGDNVVEVKITTSRNLSRMSDATVTVHVNVEKIVSVEKQIKAEYTGEDPIGQDVEFNVVSDKRVIISGAETLVNSVDYVRAEVKSLSGRSNDEIIEVRLVPVNSKGERVRNVKLSSSKAQVRISELATKKVALSAIVTGSPENGYTYDGIEAPASIIIKGKQSELDNISEVKAKAVDISGMKATAEVELEVELPVGISVSSESLPIVATINISEATASEKTVSIDSENIDINGPEEGLKYTISEEKLKITVRGDDNASAKDFRLSADLSGLDAGSHDVDLNMDYDGPGTIVSAPDKIKVEIAEE